MQLVRFRTATGGYALPIETVLGVRQADGIMTLPGSEAGVAGILDWDGETVTVIAPLGTGGRQLLLVDGGGQRYGLLVDEVVEIARRTPEEIEQPPEGVESDFVTGVLRSDLGLEFLLDAGRLWEEMGLEVKNRDGG